MTARTATDIVIACENNLGFTHPDDKPLWKSRAIEAGKLNKQIAKDPEKVTFYNLELAIEYCRRQKTPVKSPAALVWRIDDALRETAVSEDQGDVQAQIDAAVTHELSTQRFGHDAWVARLMQARGPFRKEVLQEWEAAGRNGGTDA